MSTNYDGVKWRSHTVIEKYSPDQVAYVTAMLGRTPTGEELSRWAGSPEDGVHEDPTSNLLTTVGLDKVTKLIVNTGSPIAVTSGTTRLGVGNSSTAALVSDVDLGAAAGTSNRQFYVMDSTYPLQANGVLTYKSTFASGDANFAWNEWCVDVNTATVANGTTVATAPGYMLNHKIAAMGTKASGASWALTATITLS